MRLLAALGALLFLYLAVIPAGLAYSTLDSACAGAGCEGSLASRVGFTALYAACLAAVLGCAGLFAAHAARGSLATQRRLLRGLAVAGAIVGTVLFVLFLVAFPLGGVLALALAAAGYLAARALGGRYSGPDRAADAPGANGRRALGRGGLPR